MAKDSVYTNGVIAAKEKYLLKDRLFKMCASGAEDALRILAEIGFGKGAESASVYDYENLVEADDRAIDAFIREYSPSAAETQYLLAPRDFHNAKAIVKAVFLNLDLQKMLAPEGMLSVNGMLSHIQSGEYDKLGANLGLAVKTAVSKLSSGGAANGAEIGIIFEKALYVHLNAKCAKNPLLKKLISFKADMTNILTALRSGDKDYAEKNYVEGGKLTPERLAKLFSEDKEYAARSFELTPYADFVKKCFNDINGGRPLTDAERAYESFETEYLGANRYALKAEQPFLYYVFRRRAENANVRILFVCLLAGMKEQEIKNRLRVF